MSKITKIEEQKNKSRVNIFVDGAFFCGLQKETAIIFGLKTGADVDEKKLEEAVKSSEIKRAFEKGADYLASRMHSKKELIAKLLKKGFSREVAEAAVAKLEEYSYIDDGAFARAFVQENSRYSKLVLSQKLKEKGIDRVILEEALDLIDEDAEFELCLKYAKKYANGRDLTQKQERQKLFNSLSRRGFGFDLIKKVCNNLFEEDDEYADTGEF